MNLGVNLLESGERMMNLLISMIDGLLLIGGYFGLYIGLKYLFDNGIFETDYISKGIVKNHFVIKDCENSIREWVKVEYEFIPRTKKWYKPYEWITYLPDRYFFDCDKTKQIWEKMNNANKI